MTVDLEMSLELLKLGFNIYKRIRENRAAAGEDLAEPSAADVRSIDIRSCEELIEEGRARARCEV